MNRNSVNWYGPWVAAVTPFDAAGNIDESAYRRNVDLLVGYGCTGIVANGCMGEFWAQTFEERCRVMELCADTVHGRATVIGGTSAITTSEVIALSEVAKQVGCDGVQIVPPYFVKPPEDDVVAHYQAVSDAVDIPILLYNIPSAASVVLTPELVDRLADIENVVAIKESSRDFVNFYKTLEAAGDRIHVFVGPGGLFGVAAATVGAAGYVEGHQNYWPFESTQIYHATKRGDTELALRVQKKGLALRQLIEGNGRYMYSSAKAAMNVLGLPGGYPRPPLRPLARPHLDELRKGLERLGIKGLEAAAAE